MSVMLPALGSASHRDPSLLSKAAAVGYTDLCGLSNSDGKWESLSDAVNNVWQRQGCSTVDNRWAETCGREAFWLCAGD